MELEFHRGLFLGLVLAFDPKKTFTHVARMPHLSCTTMPTNEKTDPVQVSLLGAEAIVQVTNKLPDLVQQSCGAQNRRAGFHGKFIPVFFRSVSSASPGCKPLSGGGRAQNIPHRPAYSAGSAG